MNKTYTNKRSSSNSYYMDQKNQAFKFIKDYLSNKHQELHKRPDFRDVEIAPVDINDKQFTKRIEIRKIKQTTLTTPNEAIIFKSEPSSAFIAKSFDTGERKLFINTIKQTPLSSSNSLPNEINSNKMDYIKGLVSYNSNDSVIIQEINQNKKNDKNQLNQSANTSFPKITPRSYISDSPIKRPDIYLNYKQSGFKVDGINTRKYGNYFVTHVGAPRNWLKSKFQLGNLVSN